MYRPRVMLHVVEPPGLLVVNFPQKPLDGKNFGIRCVHSMIAEVNSY